MHSLYKAILAFGTRSAVLLTLAVYHMLLLGLSCLFVLIALRWFRELHL